VHDIFLFFTESIPALGPTKRPVKWVSVGVKRPGCEAGHSSASSADVKNRVAVPPIPYEFSWRDA
jgi:hypothetical protein